MKRRRRGGVSPLGGGRVGTNPFNALGSLWIDIRQGSFNAAGLQLADFNSAPSARKVGYVNKLPSGGWYSGALNAIGLGRVNRAGLTRLRLYFNLDDNNNRIADLMRFVSGNGGAAMRPVLTIQYTLP